MAIDKMRSSIVLAPGFLDARVVLGKMFAREGKSSEAIECWKTVLDINPDHEKARKYLAEAGKEQSIDTKKQTFTFITCMFGFLFVAAVVLLGLVYFEFQKDRRLPIWDLIERVDRLENEQGAIKSDLANTAAEISLISRESGEWRKAFQQIGELENEQGTIMPNLSNVATNLSLLSRQLSNLERMQTKDENRLCCIEQSLIVLPQAFGTGRMGALSERMTGIYSKMQSLEEKIDKGGLLTFLYKNECKSLSKTKDRLQKEYELEKEKWQKTMRQLLFDPNFFQMQEKVNVQ
jgi:tetratricopeptide (TPR) repeat protein